MLSLADLTEHEAAALGPLQRLLTEAVCELTGCDQVYCCLWSHAGWEPVHIHFVLQPAWNADRARFDGPGPATQAAMLRRGALPPESEVAAAAERVRRWLGQQPLYQNSR